MKPCSYLHLTGLSCEEYWGFPVRKMMLPELFSSPILGMGCAVWCCRLKGGPGRAGGVPSTGLVDISPKSQYFAIFFFCLADWHWSLRESKKRSWGHVFLFLRHASGHWRFGNLQHQTRVPTLPMLTVGSGQGNSQLFTMPSPLLRWTTDQRDQGERNCTPVSNTLA